MYRSKNSNPFSYHSEPYEKSLDEIIGEIKRVNSLNFDTWYQTLFKILFFWVPEIKWKRDWIYDVNEETGEIYIGPERRKKARITKFIVDGIHSVTANVKHAMMPKTVKIRLDDEDGAA